MMYLFIRIFFQDVHDNSGFVYLRLGFSLTTNDNSICIKQGLCLCLDEFMLHILSCH